MKMDNKTHVLDFAQAATKFLRERLEALGGLGEEGETFSLIVVTQDNLYHIDKYAFVDEHDQFMASGSGEVYVMSAILARLDKVETVDSLKELMYDSLDIACRMNTSCGGPIIVKELNIND
jgi:ATP-dependent protease HslVU (ClpYQ) peptidase subunit